MPGSYPENGAQLIIAYPWVIIAYPLRLKRYVFHRSAGAVIAMVKALAGQMEPARAAGR